MFYIPMRYPDSMPGALADRLPNKKDALEAIDAAKKIYDCIVSLVS